MATAAVNVKRRVPVREGLLSPVLDDLTQVTLMGSRCTRCAETTLGRSSSCQNCGSEELVSIPLDTSGTLWTYTVVRHRPPGDYRGPEQFVPFGLGLVELAQGLRVLTPISGDVERLSIGQRLTFEPTIVPGGDDEEVVAFQFVDVTRADSSNG
jgi:uncharacterized protein